AELSDDLAPPKRLYEALAASQKAVAIDPRYDDYRMLETSLALRLGRAAQAGEAFSRWEQLAGGEAGDPRLAIYKAAIQLAGGSRDEAAKTLRTAADQDPDLSRELVKLDQALDGLMELLPAGAAMQAAEIQTEG
ncbi:MAG: hypothetical protein LIP23_07455, partial [Planctomycetes bacterium]|nr:hypothetical protein [Planctomycetota bacterium]